MLYPLTEYDTLCSSDSLVLLYVLNLLRIYITGEDFSMLDGELEIENEKFDNNTTSNSNDENIDEFTLNGIKRSSHPVVRFKLIRQKFSSV